MLILSMIGTSLSRQADARAAGGNPDLIRSAAIWFHRCRCRLSMRGAARGGSVVRTASPGPGSGEDARRRRRVVSRVWRARRVDQQDVNFPMCHGAVLDAPRHDKNLARVEDDRAIPQLDVERPLDKLLRHSATEN